MQFREDRPPAEACDLVVLADGNGYLLPRPTMKTVARLGADGRISLDPDSGVPAYDRALLEMHNAATDREFYRALVEASLLLLREAYAVEPDDVPRLFRFGGDGDDLAARLHAHVTGRTPAKN